MPCAFCAGREPSDAANGQSVSCFFVGHALPNLISLVVTCVQQLDSLHAVFASHHQTDLLGHATWEPVTSKPTACHRLVAFVVRALPGWISNFHALVLFSRFWVSVRSTICQVNDWAKRRCAESVVPWVPYPNLAACLLLMFAQSFGNALENPQLCKSISSGPYWSKGHFEEAQRSTP